VGEHYKVARVPVIKKQSLAAYDPRVVEGTGISMMTTAQGADHTTGALLTLDTKDMSTAQVVAASFDIQTAWAAVDSLGLCIFGRAVTAASTELIVTALNDAHGTQLDAAFMRNLGLEALKMERAFNREAGFTERDDELPAFFYNEPLAPTNRKARHHSAEINRCMEQLLADAAV